jgi:putative FmdB family regulatory protein
VPTYQYVCTDCGEDLEVVQKFSDAALTTHEACGGKLRKVYSPVGIVFKGSGFYRTDSRGSSSVTGSGGSSEGNSSNKSDKSEKSADSGSSTDSKSSKSSTTSGDSGSSSGSATKTDSKSDKSGSKSSSATKVA